VRTEKSLQTNSGALSITASLDPDLETVRAGFSFCKSTDEFNKKKGRELSSQRRVHTTNYSGDLVKDISNIFNNAVPIQEKPIKWKTIILVGSCYLKLTCLRKAF